MRGWRRKLVVGALSVALATLGLAGVGTATVNGEPGITFFVEVEDLGEPGGSAGSNPDTFRIVLGDGYGAAGALVNGNIQVHQP